MEHGQIKVLVQPAELIIIGGAGIGTLLIPYPLSTILRILKGVGSVLKRSPYNQAFYLSSLKILNDLFVMAHKTGSGQTGGGLG
jgi:chemotaxis protein MotA